jgi:DedD protein
MADNAQDPSLPQKKQARRRLVGAGVLCLGLGIALPFLFDAEPKKSAKAIDQVGVNVAVEKPAAPPPSPAVAPTVEANSSPTSPASTAPPTAPAPVTGPTFTPPAASTDAPAKAEIAKPDVTKPDVTKPEIAKPDTLEVKKPPPKTVSELIAQGDQAKAKAAQSKSAGEKPKTDGKYLVQIGAFGSSTGAQEQVKRADAIGLKAFTEEVSTNAGKRIRVRVGPFTSKEQADKARDSLKAAGIESALIAPQ